MMQMIATQGLEFKTDYGLTKDLLQSLTKTNYFFFNFNYKKSQQMFAFENIQHFAYLISSTETNLFYSTSNELLSLEKAVCAWAEWENALRDLQGALRGDLATLESLRDKGTVVGDQTEVAAQIRQLAASLVDKKKVNWLTNDNILDLVFCAKNKAN